MSKHSITVALQLAHLPGLARQLRGRPLPDDILDLIKVAGSCQDTCSKLALATGQEPEVIRAAAAHYLHLVLLYPGASSERVLGLSGAVPHEVMLQHKRWLLRWLHPDRNGDVWESAHLARVLKAWNDLTTEPSSAYDERLANSLDKSAPWRPMMWRRSRPTTALPRSTNVAARGKPRQKGLVRIGIAIVSASAVTAIAVILVMLQFSFEASWEARNAADAPRVGVAENQPGADMDNNCANEFLAVCNIKITDP